MKRFATFCLTLLCLLPVAAAISAQATPARILVSETPGDDTPFVQDENFPAIRLELTPLDQFGVPITALDSTNFALQEDDLPVANISVQASTNLARSISLLLLLDLSEPMRGELDTLKTAVISLYTVLEQSDESGLLAFSLSADGSSIAPPGHFNQSHEMNFTNDEGALVNVINPLEIPENAAAPLHQALSKALHLTANEARYQPRAILLITNGRDAANNETLALHEAQQAQLPIYIIAAGEQPDAEFLQQLASLTGGRYYSPDQPINEAFTNIVTLLKQTYNIEYTSPTPPDNKLHTLNIATRTDAGHSDVSIEFRAYYPLDPIISEITAKSPAWPEPIILGPLVRAQGLITLQPKVLARSPINSINYYVNNSQFAIFTAQEPPWSFTWDTTNLAPGQIHTLHIQALDNNDPPHVGEKEITLLIEVCSILCQFEQRTGLTANWAFIIILLLLLTAFLIIRRYRLRPAAAPPAAQLPPPPAPRPKPQTSNPLKLFQKPQPPPPKSPSRNKTELLIDQESIAFLIDLTTRKEYRLNNNRITIGSDANNEITLQSPRIAPRHVQISYSSSQYIIRKLTTAHAAKLNGRDFLRQPLADGDRLEIGDHILIFRQIT